MSERICGCCKHWIDRGGVDEDGKPVPEQFNVCDCLYVITRHPYQTRYEKGDVISAEDWARNDWPANELRTASWFSCSRWEPAVVTSIDPDDDDWWRAA